MVQQIKKNKYVTKLFLKSEEGREFLKDLLSKTMSDSQLAMLYDLTASQVKRARHKHGLYMRNCSGLRKLEARSNGAVIEDDVEVEIVEPVILRPTRAQTHTVCIDLSVEQFEELRSLANSQCRSIENQAKWILLQGL